MKIEHITIIVEGEMCKSYAQFMCGKAEGRGQTTGGTR